MFAAVSQPPIVPLRPAAPTVVEYPEDCIIWKPTPLDSVVRYNAGVPREGETDPRWRRNIVLRPAAAGPRSTNRLNADHDRVRVYFQYQEQTYRFTMERATHPPRRRFHDHGPHAALSLYSEDRVDEIFANPLISGIPMLENTVVVVTWNANRPKDRCRHVVVVPDLTIDWSRRK